MLSVDKQLNYGRSIILNYAKQIECQSLLDLGAGQGIDLDIFKNQHPLIKSYAVENWSSNIEILEKNGHVVCGTDIEKEKLPFDDNSIDCIILNQILKMNKKNITLILTPRHPERFSKVENLFKSKNIKFAKRSQASSIRLTPNFILGDSMDEMYMYYGLANVVILGGSFFNYGSQNPIEPLKMKKPTIIGPSIFNFKDIILEAIKSKAAIQIGHIHELPKTITKLSNLKTRNSMIQKSKEFISKSEGSSRKALKIISQYF